MRQQNPRLTAVNGTTRSTDIAGALISVIQNATQPANDAQCGAPRTLAAIGAALCTGHLQHDPANHAWQNRDQIVLTNSRASSVLFPLLELTGYAVGPARAPRVSGADPVQQTVFDAVQIALAERKLAAEFNEPDLSIVDHRTYVLATNHCVNSDLHDGAFKLAGEQGLNKLIVLCEGNTRHASGELIERFASFGFNVIGPVDGHNVIAVGKAIAQAKAQLFKPSIIICDPLSPRRPDAVAPEKSGDKDRNAALRVWDNSTIGAARRARWQALFAAYSDSHPQQADRFERAITGRIEDGISLASEQVRSQSQPFVNRTVNRSVSMPVHSTRNRRHTVSAALT